jgi:hypothetical protein
MEGEFAVLIFQFLFPVSVLISTYIHISMYLKLYNYNKHYMYISLSPFLPLGCLGMVYKVITNYPEIMSAV